MIQYKDGSLGDIRPEHDIIAALPDLLKTGEVKAVHFGTVPDLMQRKLDIDGTKALADRLGALEAQVADMKPDHSTIHRPTADDILRLGLEA